MDKVLASLKAVFALIAPGIIGLIAATQQESAGHDHITSGEWIGILASMVVLSGGVYLTPNKDRKGRHQDESVQPAGR